MTVKQERDAARAELARAQRHLRRLENTVGEISKAVIEIGERLDLMVAMEEDPAEVMKDVLELFARIPKNLAAGAGYNDSRYTG